jgi:CheY-like chemotaxis protein
MENSNKRQGANRDQIPPARILVIDDEEVVHVSLRRILGRGGHQVDTELSAVSGLERLAGQPYDLVITDLMMPEMNGIELLKEMRARGLNVPVLMITGYPTISTALEALRLDAMDYIAKPFTRQELLGPVHRALRRGMGGEVEASPVITETGPGSEGLERSCPGMETGVRMCLRRHSWALCCQDGTVKVGIQPSFLEGIGEISTAKLPEESDLVEQGYAGIYLRTVLEEEHAVFMPLSGRVVAVNEEVAGQAAAIDADTWLVRVLPDRLDIELSRLSRCRQRPPNQD